MQLEPHTRCKPSGGPRQWLTPYGAEFLELPEAKVAYIFDIGGPHTYRTIYMDGRKHPETLTPSFYGHSIGWWEGDTLVVDSVGFNEGFWIDRGQIPHTSKLHLIEKYTRTSLDTMKYELTVDDPGAYTSTFTGVSNLRWENGTELFEYVCQQQNYAPTLMVGEGTTVDRTSPMNRGVGSDLGPTPVLYSSGERKRTVCPSAYVIADSRPTGLLPSIAGTMVTVISSPGLRAFGPSLRPSRAIC
jgi:hypothetical protein